MRDRVVYITLLVGVVAPLILNAHTPVDLGLRLFPKGGGSNVGRLLEESHDDSRIPLEGVDENEEMEDTHRYCLKIAPNSRKGFVSNAFASLPSAQDIAEYKFMGVVCATLDLKDVRTLLNENPIEVEISFATYTKMFDQRGRPATKKRKFDRRVLTESTLSREECEEQLSGIENETNSWFLDRINQLTAALDDDESREIEATHPVHVFIVDTGINGDLSEFAGHLADPDEHATTTYVDNVDDICEFDPLCDKDGHGTHVAGIAAGEFGYSQNAILHSIKALTVNGTGSDEGILKAYNIVVEISTERGYRSVMNASLGGEKSYLLTSALDDVDDHGILVVVAGGNDGTDACLETPSSSRKALTVGATSLKCEKLGSGGGPLSEDTYELQDTIAWFSNHGDCIDLYAPGENIWSSDTNAVNDGDKINFSGTSMAAPLVAGVAAAVRGKHPLWSHEDVREYLLSIAQFGIVENISGNLQNNLLNSIETLKCPSGYFEEELEDANGDYDGDLPRRCTRCDPGCASCSGPLPGQCFSCLSSAFQFDCTGLSEDDHPSCTSEFFCTFHCPVGFYEDPENGICQPCSNECDSCNGPDSSDCTSCPEGKILYRDRGTCEDSCPDYTYEDNGSCVGCANSPTPRDYGDASSKVAYYDEREDFTCYKCDRQCRTCGADANDCFSCYAFSYLYVNSEDWGFCRNGCPSGTYLDTRGCLSCPENCLECVGPSAPDCRSCAVGLVLSENGDCTEDDCFSPAEGQDIDDLTPIIIESVHPYCNGMEYFALFSFTHAEVVGVLIEFDSDTEFEADWDPLSFSRDAAGEDVIQNFDSGTAEDFYFEGTSFYIHFSADGTINYYGFALRATPLTSLPGQGGDEEEDNSNQTPEEVSQGDEEEEDETDGPCTTFQISNGATFEGVEARVIDSPHPYCSNMNVNHYYKFETLTVRQIEVTFSPETKLELEYDYLIFASDANFEIPIAKFYSDSYDAFTIPSHEFYLKFASDDSVQYHGFTITLQPIEGEPRDEEEENGEDSEFSSCAPDSSTELEGYDNQNTILSAYLRYSLLHEPSILIDIETASLDLSRYILYLRQETIVQPVSRVREDTNELGRLSLAIPPEALNLAECNPLCDSNDKIGVSCPLEILAFSCSSSSSTSLALFELQFVRYSSNAFLSYVSVSDVGSSDSQLCSNPPQNYRAATLQPFAEEDQEIKITLNFAGIYDSSLDYSPTLQELEMTSENGEFLLTIVEAIATLSSTMKITIVAPERQGVYSLAFAGEISPRIAGKSKKFYSQVIIDTNIQRQEEEREEENLSKEEVKKEEILNEESASNQGFIVDGLRLEEMKLKLTLRPEAGSSFVEDNNEVKMKAGEDETKSASVILKSQDASEISLEVELYEIIKEEENDVGFVLRKGHSEVFVSSWVLEVTMLGNVKLSKTIEFSLFSPRNLPGLPIELLESSEPDESEIASLLQRIKEWNSRRRGFSVLTTTDTNHELVFESSNDESDAELSNVSIFILKKDENIPVEVSAEGIELAGRNVTFESPSGSFSALIKGEYSVSGDKKTFWGQHDRIIEEDTTSNQQLVSDRSYKRPFMFFTSLFVVAFLHLQSSLS